MLKAATRRWRSSTTCTAAATARRYAAHNALWEAVGAAAREAGIGLTLAADALPEQRFRRQPLRADQARFDQRHRRFPARRRDAAGAPSARRTAPARSAPAPLSTACARCRSTPLRERRARLRAHRPRVCRCTSMSRSRCWRWRPACADNRRAADRAAAAITGLRRRALVPGARHARHAARDSRAWLRASGGVCVSITHRGAISATAFSMRALLEARRAPVRRLRQPVDGESGRGTALARVPAAPAQRRRGVLAGKTESHVGTRLWRGPREAGARALGQPVGSIGGRMPRRLAGARCCAPGAGRRRPRRRPLDRLLFAGAERAIRDVMVAAAGWCKDGRHAADDADAT